MAWAIDSHAKALAARPRLRAEILSLAGHQDDAFTRSLTPALAARAPRGPAGLTAATTAVSADAAALCLVVSPRLAARAPRALHLVQAATIGARPEDPALAPLAAIDTVLSRAGRRPTDLAQAEIMEAYAIQAIACVEGAGLDPALVNPAGGALARGHPIAASGAILALRLFHDLKQGRGLAAIAAAGGLGSALLVEA